MIVGGAVSGKRRYAASLGYGPEQMADAVLDGRPVVLHAERLAAEAENLDALAEQLAGKAVVTCREAGSGVIPAAREKRLEREAIGRLSILLARRAETVVRMVCGIPTAIKGELP